MIKKGFPTPRSWSDICELPGFGKSRDRRTPLQRVTDFFRGRRHIDIPLGELANDDLRGLPTAVTNRLPELNPLSALHHYVTGAIERGEAEPIVEQVERCPHCGEDVAYCGGSPDAAGLVPCHRPQLDQ